MHWPQWTFLALCAWECCEHLVYYGLPRQRRYNFEEALAATLIVCWILWMGGFFG